MNKILLIISREYVTRVRKPAFLVITLLGPILLAALVIGPVYLSMKEQKHYNVMVVDRSGRTADHHLHGGKFLDYQYTDNADAKKKLMDRTADAILFIPKDSALLGSHPYIELYFRDQPGMIAEEKIKSDVSNMRDEVLQENAKIDVEKLKSLQLNWEISVEDTKVGDDGKEEKTNSKVSAGIGFAGAFVMYLFIFLYGVQVMRGVMEEKTNRIVEVIVSSVRPFQLMMGKIIGVALVGLTQFLLWVILTFVLVTVGSNAILKNVASNIPDQTHNPMKDLKSGANVSQMMSDLKQNNKGDNFDAGKLINDLVQRNIYFLVGIFIFYFLGGYLLYSALFAAVGSAVDSEADVQQFMLPVTAPVIFAIAMSSTVMTNPSGPLAVWLSMIPFTSPVIMMVRLPFLQFGWELVLSMGLLVVGFVLTTWLAAKIYRTGILMYGKKVSWKELGKWLFYKA
ncbi:MAG TPA: ABC transporter permease [Bacteroidia bacterium]|jgi:ABC-2 type transport system permease protein